ncbi:hypothetical protein, partial [uncultured Arthrobacter sp.]|uniref:hypothetical protein n=1 Tax=uncultured Arthrobacter sp. TaxID=114050 RepID=UPI0025D58A2E
MPKCEVDVEDESGKFICSYSALYLPAVGDLLLASPGYRNAARRDEQSVYQVVRREWDLDEEPAPTLR